MNEPARPAPQDEVQAAEAEREALAQAERAGIHRVAVPTPFRVGRINAYLIEDSPLTLIDAGPNSATALDQLEQGLAALGHAVEELELLVITHQHIDHFGLAAILARRSGAQVAALDRLAPYLADFRTEAQLDDSFAEAIMLRHGIPPEVATMLRAVSANFRAWGAPVAVDRPLGAGEELALRDRTLRVLHRPGHSPSDTIFLDQSRSILFAGDHLLKNISSNPLIARPLPPAGEPAAGAHSDAEGRRETSIAEREPSLLNYIDSLTQTREMELSLVLPGHGPPITDHRSLVDDRLRLHERRARRILELVCSHPLTVHEIALELWGNIAVTQAYLTLSEVIGHLDLLIRDGLVEELDDDGLARFTALAAG